MALKGAILFAEKYPAWYYFLDFLMASGIIGTTSRRAAMQRTKEMEIRQMQTDAGKLESVSRGGSSICLSFICHGRSRLPYTTARLQHRVSHEPRITLADGIGNSGKQG
jgi:hypothetical protein